MAGALFGDVGMLFGDSAAQRLVMLEYVGMSLFVAGAAFGDVGALLFVAGAAFFGAIDTCDPTKGCTQHHKIAILPQFCAIDTHDLRKGLIGKRQDRHFTTVSHDRHARSYERVAFLQAFSGAPPATSLLK